MKPAVDIAAIITRTGVPMVVDGIPKIVQLEKPVRANVAPEVETHAAESKWICVCGFDNFATRQVCFHCMASKGSLLMKVKGVVSRVVTQASHYYAFIESEEGFFASFREKI